MINATKIRALEVRLAETAKDLDNIIQEYFPNQILDVFGDTAGVVRLLQFQTSLVDQLGVQKAKLRESKK